MWEDFLEVASKAIENSSIDAYKLTTLLEQDSNVTLEVIS